MNARHFFTWILMFSLMNSRLIAQSAEVHFSNLKVSTQDGILRATGNTLSITARELEDGHRVTISNRKTNSSCDFSLDGFIAPEKIYLSRDEKVFAVFSGYATSMGVYFFNTASCSSYGGTAIEGNATIERDQIIQEAYCGDGICEGKNCPCYPSKIFLIGPNMKLTFLPEASLSHTEKLIGVPFSKPSTVDFPKSKKARLVR
jgi:hypothetical protein